LRDTPDDVDIDARSEEFGWFRLPKQFMTPGEQAIVGMINVEAQLSMDNRKRLRYNPRVKVAALTMSESEETLEFREIPEDVDVDPRAEEYGWFRLPNHFMTPGEQALVGMINVEAQLCMDSRKRLRYNPRVKVYDVRVGGDARIRRHSRRRQHRS
jgi:hypothetical protein